MLMQNRMSEFFDDKYILTPPVACEARRIVDRLSILYPRIFSIDTDEKKIYGLKDLSGEGTAIIVMDYNYGGVYEKLDRIRKVCAASIALDMDELYVLNTMPVLTIDEILHTDEKRLIELLHEYENMAYAMAKGMYCINFIDTPIYYSAYDYLTYEHKK